MNELYGMDVKKNTAKPNEYYMNCPFCVQRGEPEADTRYRLGFNTKSGIYHCYRCKAVGNIKDISELKLLADYQPDDSFSSILDRVDALDKSSEMQTINLEEMSWEINKAGTPIAYKYMIDRGYINEELKRYQVRVGRDYWDDQRVDRNGELKPGVVTKWSGRIIFPFFFEGQCIYAVGRAYAGKEPKYYNSPFPKGLVVYGIDDIKNGKAILCEGIISAHAAERTIGISAVSFLGKSPLPMQLTRVRNKCNTVYKCLDGDVPENERRKFDMKILEAGFEHVWDVRLPFGEDPDSLKQGYKSYFNNAQKVSLF